ncbi:DUF4296 domain-containing protein [Autumnicola psychrophila]|uniref:DUF4296 domain-containing protein n=1 Tax=Autumnicola psychrophila TaxID=3075592 RepID=A0ABU3DN86_9FLAO|nr:DUF4296 domain-containing protein [Zunongwangia sp. F225]MDT0685177.1 DUF4296 domain-containing protein [Zunongwangia sp. F225]
MKNILLFFLVVILFSGCRNIERTEKPDDLIGEEKMVDVLTELAILQSARNLNKTVLEDAGIKPYQYIYEKHDIDSLQLERSNDYYTENFTTYEIIFERVRDRLQRVKEARDSIQQEEERIQDSISKLDSVAAQDSIPNDSLRDSIRRQDSINDVRDIRRRNFISRDSLISSREDRRR